MMKHPVYSFLLDYLTDLNIHYLRTENPNLELSDIDLGLRNSILTQTDIPSPPPLNSVNEQTIYHISDYYRCGYSFFKFPEKDELLFIGPYLTNEFSFNDIHSIMDELQIPNELFPQLQDYYNALPTVPVKESFSSLLRHAYANIFSSELPTVLYLDLKSLESQKEFLKKHQFYVPEDSILSMRMLEERYHEEDNLLDAVAHGNYAKAISIMETMASTKFVPRSDNELRNQKNMTITLNSLMRRVAYSAGVHPFYIDAVSSNYGILLEKCTSVEEIYDIIPFMTKSYCDLVDKRSMSSYSEPVRQILVTIDASLAGDLSLKRFANDLFLNTSYLSTLFKKEVGMALTDYVNKNRISAAKKLLKSTTIPIQDIAAQCGIPDIHYFTRLFHREVGMSPREWRKQ